MCTCLIESVYSKINVSSERVKSGPDFLIMLDKCNIDVDEFLIGFWKNARINKIQRLLVLKVKTKNRMQVHSVQSRSKDYEFHYELTSFAHPMVYASLKIYNKLVYIGIYKIKNSLFVKSQKYFRYL